MTFQNPATPPLQHPSVGERVQPGSPLSGAVKRGGETHIYFIQAVPEGLIKIGMARCAVHRLQGLATMSPVPLKMLGILICHEGGALERRLHAKFANDRAHGEWFRPSEDLRAFIAENALAAKPKRRLNLLERRERNRIRRDRKKFTEERRRQEALDAELAAWDAKNDSMRRTA